MGPEQIDFYITIGTAALVFITFILVIVLVIWYKGLRKTELKTSELISKMEKGDKELHQKIHEDLERIKSGKMDPKTSGEEDLVSYVMSFVTPTITSYVKSWF